MGGPSPELRARLERFSLLRKAQRALARCMHPAALEPLQEDARRLLIRLKAALREPAPADGGAVLAEIDGLLTQHAGQTRELVGKLQFAQLRAAGPELCREKPDELRALLDVMLLGGISQPETIGRIEYLVTMLCAEDETGRRSQVREPSELTPGLRQIARRKASEPGIDVDAAVARLEEAARSLVREDDHLERRDGIRRFKQELGAGLLHPRVLAAAVAYNIAMANHVSARIDGTLALDHLTEDLLVELKQPATGDSTLLHGDGMAQIRNALRARVRGAGGDDGSAARVAAAFDITGLVLREVEALEGPEEDPLDRLIVSAVVVGCVLRQQTALAQPLREMGLDPAQLERDGLPALLREFEDASAKFFADSCYSEAFVLSEAKARNLSAVEAAVVRRGRKAEEAASAESDAGAHSKLPFGLSPARLGLIAGPILGLLLGAQLFAAFADDTRAFSPSELAEISPFLDSGHQRTEDGAPHFVGQLFPTWSYLETPQRQEIADAVASHFKIRGVRNGVLLLPGPREMVRWEEGKVTALVPAPAD